MTARDIQRRLSQMYYLTQEVERDELRLRELRAAAEKSTQQITGMPGAGGAGDRVGRYAIEIAELRRRLEEKQRACFCELTRLEDFIASVEDSQMRIILTLAVGCLLIALEGWLDGKAAFSGLLGVMGMAVMLRRCGDVQAVSAGVGKLWRAAEVMLFVLVGAAVDIRYTMQAGAGAVLLIALALVIRSVGVCLCVAVTKLTKKERLFCVIAYLPKATVQAAIGATPLAMGLPCGNLVLSVAVLAILLTAPLGAIGMDATADRLLQK